MRSKLLLLTILSAALLRFVGLGHNPPALNWDEVAIGWNAYSILETGKDEYGAVFPLTFRSFDDYKSPLYIYLTSVAIMLFGKTEFAIRFTSAFFGTLTVIIFYFFTKRLLKTASTDPIWQNRIANVALFGTGIMAISPWHVHFSRVAFEANIALFFEILGTLLFLRWVERRKYSTIIFSVLAYAAALYSYASARLIIALLLVGYGIYFHKVLFKAKKQVSLAIICALIVSIPLIMQMYQGVGFARFNATTILGKNVIEIFTRNDTLAKEDFDAGNGWLSSKVHNFRIPIATNVIQNYLYHYNYGFLFNSADLPRHQIPGFGLLYLWQLPLIAIGAVFLIKNRKQINAVLPLWWLFIAPIPAALTWQVPHAIRALAMLPIFSVLSGLGLWAFFKWMQKIDLRAYTRPMATTTLEKMQNLFHWIWPKTTYLLTMFLMSISAVQMVVSYHVLLPAEFSPYWLYGRKEMVSQVENRKNNFDHVVVSLSLDWAYLWFLWYGNYDPQWYLNQGGTVSGSFEESQNTVGKIQFFNFDYFKLKQTPNILMIGSPKDFPGGIIPDQQILDLSGKPIIYIVKS